MAITPSSQFSNELATTAILDADVLNQVEVTGPEFKDLLVRLGYFINDIVDAVNKKDTGFYPLQEYACSKRIFPNPAYAATSFMSQEDRPVFRTTINFGALPNAGTKSIPHNISVTPGLTWTLIQAVATDPRAAGLTGLPIPYVDPTALANGIGINVDATNVNITTGSNRTNYSVCLVYLEYVQT